MCQQDNSKKYGRIFLKFSGNARNSKNYQWFNFGGNPEGILDSGFRFFYHWEIMKTAAKPNMVMPPGEQHGVGGGLRSLTAFLVIIIIIINLLVRY